MEAIIFYSRNTCCVYWNVSLHVIWFFWTYQSHLTAAVSQYNGKFHSTLKNHLRPKSELKWRRVWKNVSLKCQTNITSLWKNGVRSWDSWSAEAWLRVCVCLMDGWMDRPIWNAVFWRSKLKRRHAPMSLWSWVWKTADVYPRPVTHAQVLECERLLCVFSRRVYFAWLTQRLVLGSVLVNVLSSLQVFSGWIQFCFNVFQWRQLLVF